MQLLLIVAAVSATCDRIIVRKEVSDLSDSDWRIYEETIQKAMETPDFDAPSLSIWEAAAQFHNAHSKDVYGHAPFFYWHRSFLVTVEKKLQKLNKDFFFPYFDHSRVHNRVDDSPIWKHVDLGTKTFKVRRQKQKRVLRSREEFSNLHRNSQRKEGGFAFWSKKAEVWNGHFHVAVGGDMKSMLSPRDPTFYSHHAFYDYEWSKAQAGWAKNKLPQIGRRLRDGSEATYSSRIPGYKNSVFRDAHDLVNLCIRYAPHGENQPPRLGATSTSLVTLSTFAIPVTQTTSFVFTTTSVTPGSTLESTSLGTTTTSFATTTFTEGTTTASTSDVTTTSTVTPFPGFIGENTTALTSTTHETTTLESATHETTTLFLTATDISTTAESLATPATYEETALDPELLETLYRLPDNYKENFDEVDVMAECPQSLPEDWMSMSNLNVTLDKEALDECNQVLSRVKAGEAFEPIPIPNEQDLQEVVNALPTDGPKPSPIGDLDYSSITVNSAFMASWSFMGLASVVLFAI